MKSYDLVISGAGMVGSLAALMAVKQGYSVLLIEAGELASFDSKKSDLRVSAISYSNYQLLKSLKVNSNFDKNSLNLFTKMQVWDDRIEAELNFSQDEFNSSALGVMIENKHLIYAIHQELKSFSQIEILSQTKISSFEDRERYVKLTLNTDDEIKAKLLLACDGRDSKIRDFIHIKSESKSYDQKGLVAYVEIPKADNHTAYQVFIEQGPLALLPFGNQLFSIVWTMSHEKAESYKKLNDSEFEKKLESHINAKLGKVKLQSSRASFPLSQLKVAEYFKGRVVLAGDSAHAIHPLAGQGANLGIENVSLLFDLLKVDDLKNRKQLHIKLRKYQRRRLSKVNETSELMSFINYMFKDDEHLKQPLRSLGFKLINHSPLKKWLLTKAGS